MPSNTFAVLGEHARHLPSQLQPGRLSGSRDILPVSTLFEYVFKLFFVQANHIMAGRADSEIMYISARGRASL